MVLKRAYAHTHTHTSRFRTKGNQDWLGRHHLLKQSEVGSPGGRPHQESPVGGRPGVGRAFGTFLAMTGVDESVFLFADPSALPSRPHRP